MTMLKKITLLLALVLITSLTNAQWKSTPGEDNIICAANANQNSAVAISDGEGGAYVAWTDYRNPGNDADVYMQRVDKDGNLLFQENGIPICVEASNQLDIRLVLASDKSVIATWVDFRKNFTNSSDLYAQKIDPDGKVKWAINGVPVSNYKEALNGDISQHQSVKTNDGGFYSAWTISYFGYLMLRAQRVDKNGKILWDSVGVKLTDGAVDTRSPQAMFDNKNGGLIVSYRHSGVGTYPIYFNWLDTAGVLKWPAPGKVAATNGTQGLANVVSLSGYKDYLYAFTWIPEGQTVAGRVVFQIIDSLGNSPLGPEGKIVNSLTNNSFPQIGWDKDNSSFYLIWADGRRPGVNTDIYAQKLNDIGDPQWTENGVLVTDQNTYGPRPQIIKSNNGYIAVWNGASGQNFGLNAQLLDQNGIRKWNIQGVVISSKNPSAVVVSSFKGNEFGGAIFIYSAMGEPANTGENIYAKRVNYDGSLGNVTSVESDYSTDLQHFPNPTTNQITIRSDKQIGKYRFVISNLFGQEIINKSGIVLDNSITFNLGDIQSGHYNFHLVTENEVISKPIIIVK